MDVSISSQPRSVVFLRNAEDIDAIFAKFPGPVSISPSRHAWSYRARLIGRLSVVLLIILLSAPFAVLLINGISIGNWAWTVFASTVLGLSLSAVLAMLLRTRQPGFFLVLDKDGFAVRNGRAYQSCRWTDVRDFRLAGIIRLPRIRFKNFSPSARGRVVLGLGEDALKFLIPYRDGALASLMNQWRERALAGTDTSGSQHEIDRQ